MREFFAVYPNQKRTADSFGINLGVAVSPEPPLKASMSIMLLLLPAVLSIAWSGIMTFDIIVFALTLYKAIIVGYRVPLIQAIVLDGKC